MKNVDFERRERTGDWRLVRKDGERHLAYL
jgi:hypothetical protein